MDEVGSTDMTTTCGQYSHDDDMWAVQPCYPIMTWARGFGPGVWTWGLGLEVWAWRFGPGGVGLEVWARGVGLGGWAWGGGEWGAGLEIISLPSCPSAHSPAHLVCSAMTHLPPTWSALP